MAVEYETSCMALCDETTSWITQSKVNKNHIRDKNKKKKKRSIKKNWSTDET